MFKIFRFAFCCLLFINYSVQSISLFKNNVCPTIEDYLSKDDNPNCEYDITADTTSIVDIALHYGYSTEEHKVVTEDKYVLTVFHLYSNQFHRNGVSMKQPVFLQHGWANSALNFFGRGNESLPFVLIEAGYDVWLGNFRTTEYSEEHLNFTVYDPEFWDYTIDDLAAYDMPAQLDHVFQETKQKVIYIGYSLGTTTVLMYSSAFPKLSQSKLKLTVLLAPAPGLQNSKAPLIKIIHLIASVVYDIIRNYGLMRLTSQTEILRGLFKTVCTETPYMMNFCLQAAGVLLTGPSHQISYKTMPVLYNQIFSGISIRIGNHLAMLYNGFTKYNYAKDNVKIYGSNHPPTYKVSKILVPVLVFYARNDFTTTIEEAVNLYKNLNYKARYGILEVQAANFNHQDFIYGSNARHLVYDRIVKVLNNT